MHWYDRVYEACKHSNGYTAPEAFYGVGKIISSGCAQQHKTFSYVDYRSGKDVRLYGIVNRHASGADADFLISEIVGDLLPFDRTTDHILNNNPSDRDIYCLLEEVLRKVYRTDMSGNPTCTSLYHGIGLSESLGFYEKNENNSMVKMNNLPNENFVNPTNGVNLPNSILMNQPINETVAQKLNVMEFLNFYKDIIERVDQAADEDEKRKYINSADMNQNNPNAPPFNQYDGFMPPEAQVQYSNQFFNQQSGQYPNQFLNQQSVQYPNQYPMENPYPYIEPASYNNQMYRAPAPMYSSKRRGGTRNVNKKYAARNAPLVPISKSTEKWWTEEGEYLTDRNEQLDYGLSDDRIPSEKKPLTFQQTSMTTAIEVARRDDDDEFLHAAEKPAIDIGYIENSAYKESGEAASVKSDDKISMMYSTHGESVTSYTSVAVVFIYGDKMFVGSIGDSRIILMRQKCHYLDVMYLNEPPLAWYPVAATKNPCIKGRHYILFQEPVIRGGFLINECSIFLLMFNDGVITNMLNLDEFYRTSNEVNRRTVQMVIKILEKYPTGDVAQKFVAHIKHSYNRKYKSATEYIGIKRESMSFLFADLRELIPKLPTFDQLLKTYQPKPKFLESNARSNSKKAKSKNPLEPDVETMKTYYSLDKVYDMLQEIYDREEREHQAAIRNASMINDNTWVFLRTDLNEKGGYFN
ncbi:unnamed protein product [Cercopithifilaria johnstoni]|uniref:Uncharacterized protein n=1 Tax=Cercopithifilaria johnstoni TaxID=2874296 RepID=A0A8J2LVQ3_9BILA|nr:unnamed protein product [Cercopithifilaria johnstoni]